MRVLKRVLKRQSRVTFMFDLKCEMLKTDTLSQKINIQYNILGQKRNKSVHQKVQTTVMRIF